MATDPEIAADPQRAEDCITELRRQVDALDRQRAASANSLRLTNEWCDRLSNELLEARQRVRELEDEDDLPFPPAPARLQVLYLPTRPDGSEPFALVLSGAPEAYTSAQDEEFDRLVREQTGAAAYLEYPFHVDVD